MSQPEHLDELLRDWAYEPQTLGVRIVSASDGRDVLQMRIDMGVLQLELEGRPDGARPKGFESFFDYLVSESIRFGAEFVIDDEQANEVDREFVQFYHRRICWLRLQDYERAIRDADHTLGLMDFCREHSDDDQWTLSHEQYRPFVIFHRTQAAALASLDEGGPEGSIQEINDGLDSLREVFEEYEAEEHFEDDVLVTRLLDLRETLRTEYEVGKTLAEQLAEAVATEQYELAARLRDELARREV
jgi:UvrB/uvrC motif